MDEFTYTADKIRVIDLREMNLVEALSAIEKRPYLALQESDITNLKSFLNGWIVGRKQASDDQLLSDFQKFVVKEFDERDTAAAGWCEVICKHRGNALAGFFEIFNKFKSGRVVT